MRKASTGACGKKTPGRASQVRISALRVFGVSMNWGWPPSPYTRPDKSGAQSALELMCLELTKKPCLPLFAEGGPKGHISDVTFLQQHQEATLIRYFVMDLYSSTL